MAEVVTRVMVADTVNNKAVAMVANKADMAVMENAVMNAEMMIRMDSSKAVATADNKEGMVETANAATSDTTSDATMIFMDSSKAEAMARVMVEINKVGVTEEGSKVEATAEVTAEVTAEDSKAVAMVEVNKADMIKVAVVATALKTVLAEDMEGEGFSFKKVEDQVKALEVTSIPTKLSATPSNTAAAEIATCSRLHCLSWAARTSTISQAQMSRS
jgi:hypothetical protein